MSRYVGPSTTCDELLSVASGCVIIKSHWPWPPRHAAIHVDVCDRITGSSCPSLSRYAAGLQMPRGLPELPHEESSDQFDRNR